MNFIYPSFLWALTLTAIPVIIHLFNFRRHKTIYFSNVSYLKNIKEETKAKSQLKHLLVLLARILTIVALVFVFAKPYMPLNDSVAIESSSMVGIYIDNSFSMEAENTYGKLLEIAKTKANDIINAYKPETKFLLITNNLKPENQHMINRSQLADKIPAIEISPNVITTGEIIERITDIMNISEAKNKNIYILSDFQQSSTIINNKNTDSLVTINILPINAEQSNNLYIDSCWFETPARKYMQQEKLFVRIINNSQETYTNIPLKLYLNDSLKTMNSFNINPNAEQVVSLSYQNNTKGIIKCKVEITDYPITFDNKFYLSYTIAEKIKVLSISNKNPNKYINALFDNDDYIELTNFTIDNINYSVFSTYQTIIVSGIDSVSSGLSQELSLFAASGGTVLFVPSIEGDIYSYNKFLKKFSTELFLKIDTNKTNIKSLSLKSNIFKNAFQKIDKNADLPYIKQHFVFTKSINKNTKTLLALRNKDAILNYSEYGKGHLFCFSIPLNAESSNFTQHPLFIPTLYNIVLNSNPSNALYYTIGKNNAIMLPNNTKGNDCIVSVVNNNGIDFKPETQIKENNINLFLSDEIKTAGNYLLKCNETILYGLAFNYDNKESKMPCYNIEEIKKIFIKYGFTNINILDINDEYISNNIRKINEGIQLWKYFLILALLFIMIEILLLRFLK